MRVLTSTTIHTTSAGETLSYTYSVIDENTGAVISENNRESMVLLNIPANKEILQHIAAIDDFLNEKLGE